MVIITISLSIILRSREGEDLTGAIKSIQASSGNHSEIEIIIVSNSTTQAEFFQDKIHILRCDAKRMEAKLLGVRMANSDKVLFLDSDQTVSIDLIPELVVFNHDIGIIPERSSDNHFMAKLMDIKRIENEKHMKDKPSVSVPVVPRFFTKTLIERTLNSLGDEIIKNVAWPEDSIIFYQAMKFSNDVGWVNSVIYNFDPNLRDFVRKSFYYGSRNEKSIINGVLSEEYTNLIRRIQVETLLNNRSPNMGMLFCNLLRGGPYVLGSMLSLFKRSLR